MKTPAPPKPPSAPSGYRFAPDGQSLEAIPGGPAAKLPSEVAARLGLAEVYLQEAPEIRSQLENLGVAGRVGLVTDIGPTGEMKRRIESGADALLRNLTGAGMPLAEAEKYINRYIPSVDDGDDRLLYKHDQLVKELTSIKNSVMQGRPVEILQQNQGKAYNEAPAQNLPPLPPGFELEP